MTLQEFHHKRGQKIEMVTGGASRIERFGKDGVKCHRWVL